MLKQSIIDNCFKDFWKKMLEGILAYKQISQLYYLFLNIGRICENFKHVGNVPVNNILLQIWIKGDEINCTLNFTILDGTSS
jgi:hypothetical protein